MQGLQDIEGIGLWVVEEPIAGVFLFPLFTFISSCIGLVARLVRKREDKDYPRGNRSLFVVREA